MLKTLEDYSFSDHAPGSLKLFTSLILLVNLGSRRAIALLFVMLSACCVKKLQEFMKFCVQVSRNSYKIITFEGLLHAHTSLPSAHVGTI